MMGRAFTRPSGGPNRAWREAAARFRAEGRAAKKLGPTRCRPRKKCDKDYAALDFFVALAVGLGLDLFAILAFSFAVNSCFTLRAMASVSTL